MRLMKVREMWERTEEMEETKSSGCVLVLLLGFKVVKQTQEDDDDETEDEDEDEENRGSIMCFIPPTPVYK